MSAAGSVPEAAGYEMRVVARNPSTGSENRIHADDVARRHGFRGGLVPGVTVYGYLAGFLADTLGAEWLRSGRAEIRFRKPCYDGDELTLRVGGPAGEGPGRVVEVRANEVIVVTGSASIGGPPIPQVDIPAAETRPEGERPMVGRGELVPGTVLGTIVLDTGTDAAGAYRERIGTGATLIREKGWVHPGMLLDAANWILMAHVVMPLWLHVGSTIEHRRPVEVGEPVWVRGRVAAEWERSGHRFVTLDVSWVGPDPADVIATAAHTAIWHLAGT